ncbi:thiol reductant ABC exporter subunit CydC [Glutamicibacter uratoxydans]|uniref:thiol reductant ABC exporter subunit CydC n=1 Tax=Glutamicibacter uratoxydans TaxID=43667 RepID=UPI003D6FD24E
MAAKRFLPSQLLSRGQLVLLTCWSLAKAAGLILLAFALGRWIASLAGNTPVDPEPLLTLGVLGAILRAAAGWGLNVASRRMGLGAKERMRARLVKTSAEHTTLTAADSDFSVPVTATLAAHGLDKLDDYFTKFIPAMVTAFVLPPVLGLYILSQDLTSAIILVLTIPLVPMFMVLIGMHTQDKVAASQRGLDGLAHQLYELALGLPALLGLGRAQAQGNAIAALGQRYRKTTMDNLKTVFLSSFWLELISTLSVAVVAVFIGLRLVGGNMELAIGLTVLILAPEIFAVLRDVGSAYHAADDGLAAYQKYTALTEKVQARPLAAPAPGQDVILQIDDLQLSYRKDQPIYRDYQLTLHAGERHLLDSISGSGKTTLLKAIAEAHSATGMDPDLVSGRIGINGSLAVIEQHPVFNQPTAAEQLALDAPLASHELLQDLAQQLNLAGQLDGQIAEYSPGQLRRLEVLRALARVHSDPTVRLLLADEPTAHLDAHNAATVRRLLAELPARCAQLIASHDVLLGARSAEPASVTTDPPAVEVTDAPAEPSVTHPPAQNGAQGGFHPVRELLFGQRAATKALILGVLSVICAVGLGAVSGWLIVKASYMPPVLHLLVAIVMVRALGIGRAALRYVEQLAIHDAVLSYAGQLREKIWNAMVAQPARWGIISRSPVVLRFLLAEVDELRDLLARVVFPPLQALLVWVLGIGVMFLIQPAFGVLSLLVFGATLLIVLPLVRVLEGRNLSLALEHRLQVNEQVLGILRSRAALRANDSLPIVLQRLAAAEAQNQRRAKAHALGHGVGVMLLSLGTMLLALGAVAVSTVSPELTAVAALLALALAEPGSAAITAWQQAGGLRQLRQALAERSVADTPTPAAAEPKQTGSPVHGFELRGLALGYSPERPLFTELNALIPAGQWTAISGPSGSGKSTLLTALLGALTPLAGQIFTLDEQQRPQILTPGALTSVAWCPQEAHLFDSSLERNLALGVNGQLPTTQQYEQVLRRVGLGEWYAQQEHGLQTRIGSGGHSLSGGQRCRLAVARALLADKQVILLDEPTAHLGHEEGLELMRQLRTALAGRTVVLITHDEQLAADCENRIGLGTGRLLQNS